MCQFLKAIINHMCRLIQKPVEYIDPAPSPNFEFPMYGAEEEDYDDVPEEVSRLLEHEENTIQPYKEPLEVINLGSEEDPKEVNIGALLHPDVKSRLIELLKEYVDIFAWSYHCADHTIKFPLFPTSRLLHNILCIKAEYDAWNKTQQHFYSDDCVRKLRSLPMGFYH